MTTSKSEPNGGSGATGASVTVIVTTWNRAQSVARAIDSVLAQSYPDVHVIVVDDGSTDATDAVLARYKDETRVRVVRHTTNQGVTTAKNSGLEALDAATTWFCFLDSDDEMLPDGVEALARAFVGGAADCSQVLGWCREATSNHLTGRAPRDQGVLSYEEVLCGHLQGEFKHLARRDMLGGLRFEPRASGGEASLWWQLLRQAPAMLIPDVVCKLEQSNADRVSVPHYSAEAARRRMWAYQAVLVAVGQDMRHACPREYGALNAELAKWAAAAGEHGRASRAAMRAVRHAPSARSMLIALLWAAPGSVVRRIAVTHAAIARRSEKKQ